MCSWVEMAKCDGEGKGEKWMGGADLLQIFPLGENFTCNFTPMPQKCPTDKVHGRKERDRERKKVREHKSNRTEGNRRKGTTHYRDH